MRQYFYIVTHSVVGYMNLDYVCLQESDAITFGRRLATRNENASVYLYKQEITRTGKPVFVKFLRAYKTL